MGAVLGTLFFTHYWYWFSSIHFLSLGLAPSILMGVNIDLKAPKSF
jgi:26S proteasome regulatory subunit N2